MRTTSNSHKLRGLQLTMQKARNAVAGVPLGVRSNSKRLRRGTPGAFGGSRGKAGQPSKFSFN